MVPFVSSACKVITTVIDFAKKVEQNERNIVYLKQHGTLLQHAIDTRVRAYFSIDSVWVIDNEVCLSNYCNILIESAKVLIEIVETICQYDKRSLFGKFLGEAFKMKNAAIDLTDPQMRLDYSIKSILVLDPIHLAFNLNSIATMFHSPEAFDFWRANRFCHSAEAERLVYGLIKIASARNGLKDTALFEMKLLDELHARANGYIRAEDFGGWYSEIKFQAFLQRITTQSHQPNAIEAQIDDGS
ncbi:hypothetical protein BCR33DRAFT_561127 [Rhizoclosmatium globosum]|uniref:Uncharacterized protein n=1 Tax=Rhizoclosmatium globosum TaxID=329046 RepID=A0A1Y2CSL2_9FUNG|nr:hypothetical protein BCR33DRAFT_561127 [Rhizoclosmatium globosum]|eukprot:ORY50060.1 hypothetical protein BCR33DRAFT_561127 [Rhizoclosmatium globosum]